MKSRFASCAAVSTALGCAVLAAAGQDAPDRIGEPPAAGAVFRSAIDLVALNVIVTDGRQRFVPGLQSSDFVVLEDGVAQDVTFFSASEAPLDVAILLDTSGSMARQLPAVREAARGFLRVVREVDRVMVLDLKNTTRIIHPLDGDAAVARRSIDAVEAGGSTGLYNGLYLTMRQLTSARRPGPSAFRRQAIVVLSDGHDTASLLSFEDVRELARRTGIPIYSIQLEPIAVRQPHVSRVLSPEEHSMRELAADTGGRAFFPDTPADLAGVYESIATELAHQYALGYTPKNAGRSDGSFRRLHVQVRQPSGLRARTRAGYLASPRSGT